MANRRTVTEVCAVGGTIGLIVTGAVFANPASPTAAVSALTGYVTGSTAPDGSANPNNDTAVSGAELGKVTPRSRPRDAAVTVTSVRKDPDGSYDVFGTKAGVDVIVEVSKDLKTITTNTHTGQRN